MLVSNDGSIHFLTMGDGNDVDGRGLYSPGQLWLEKKDVIGKVKGYYDCWSFHAKIYLSLGMFHIWASGSS